MALNEQDSPSVGKSKSTPTVNESSPSTGPMSPDTETLPLWIGQPFNPLICSVEDSHAKISASPVNAQGSTEHAPASGLNTSEPFATFDPATCSWRTSLASSRPLAPSDLTDAYAAGLLDGEGCLYLAKTHKSFAARIDVGMSDKTEPLLQALMQHYGGTVRQTRPRMEKWERAVCWTITGQPAVDCLKRVVRHLRAKRDQASLLIWLYRDAIRKNERINWTETMEMALWVREQISVLNRKGPTIVPHAEGTWRTSQLNMDQQWDEFSETWPRAGTMRNGVCCQQLNTERHISENEYGYWPTPRASFGMACRLTEYGATVAAERNGNLEDKILEYYPLEAVGKVINPQFVERMMGYPVDWTE